MADLATIDQFINDADAQVAAWYTLLTAPAPAVGPKEIPLALGGPVPMPAQSISATVSTGADPSFAILLIVLAAVLVFVLAK